MYALIALSDKRHLFITNK